jgi:adenylosuccinate lyase
MTYKIIHPIESRYRTEIAELFTEEKRLEYWLKVEAVLASTHAVMGNIPLEAAREIEKKANLGNVKLYRVKEIDDEIHHDLMAMVKALSEQCEKDAGKYVHLGATSYDIEDTALALQLREALLFIKASLIELLKSITIKIQQYKDVVCIGRTHGQHAIPTTYGMRFGVWGYEVSRHLDRISEVIERISFGKMSGAVGTMASFGPLGTEIQEKVMVKLNLNPSLITNQIIQRDRHAEVIFLTSLIAQTLSKIASEFRILQRSEIAEMFEPFKKSQVGSSTMPHKRNPHKSERICSIARIIKSNVIPALDNVILEDERDLTNSASERILFAENFILLDYIIKQLTENFQGLELDLKKIEDNLNLTKGACLTEKVMVDMVKRGLGRQEAHEILRTAAIQAREENSTMKSIVMKNPKIASKLSEKELDELFDPHKYIGSSRELVEKLHSYLKNNYDV